MPAHHRFSDRGSELRTLRMRLLRLRDELGLIRRDHWLRKYNPSQPRVPAGGPGGGQWTSGAGGGGGSGGGNPDFPDGTSLDADTGWSSLGEGWNEDGSVFEQAVTDGQGTTIQSEYAASRAAGFDERQTVIDRDGNTVSFETTDKVQLIRDGGPDGEIVSQSVWGENGPDVVEARWRRGGGSGGSRSQAAGKLFDWFNSLGESSGALPVLGFRAHDYAPGKANFSARHGSARLIVPKSNKPALTSQKSRKCWMMRHARPDRRAISQRCRNTAQTFISDLENRVDVWNNPAVVAERSYFKELRELGEQPYGTAGTKRFDVFERGINGTRCLYDIKTGRELSRSEADITADAAMRIRGSVNRLLVIELRPRL